MEIGKTPGRGVWPQCSVAMVLLRGSSLARRQSLTIRVGIVIHPIDTQWHPQSPLHVTDSSLGWRLEGLGLASIL